VRQASTPNRCGAKSAYPVTRRASRSCVIRSQLRHAQYFANLKIRQSILPHYAKIAVYNIHVLSAPFRALPKHSSVFVNRHEIDASAFPQILHANYALLAELIRVGHGLRPREILTIRATLFFFHSANKKARPPRVDRGKRAFGYDGPNFPQCGYSVVTAL